MVGNMTANTYIYTHAQQGSWHADYQWHRIASVSVAKSPQKAIDAFLDVFSEVELKQQLAMLSLAYGTDSLRKIHCASKVKP